MNQKPNHDDQILSEVLAIETTNRGEMEWGKHSGCERQGLKHIERKEKGTKKKNMKMVNCADEQMTITVPPFNHLD